MVGKTKLAGCLVLLILVLPVSAVRSQTASSSPGASGSEIRVAIVGETQATIISESDLSVVASLPLPKGWVEGVWAADDGTRLTVLTQVGIFSAKEPANLTVLDLERLQVLGQHEVSFNLQLEATADDGKSGFLVFKGGKAKKRRPASPPTLVGWNAESATISGSVPLDSLPDSIHLLAGVNRVVLAYHGEPARVPAKRSPGRIEVFDSVSLTRQRIIPLPGPVVDVIADNRSVLFALDLGTDRKKPEETLASRVYVVDPRRDGLLADLEVGVGASRLSWDEQREVFYFITHPRKAEGAAATLQMIRGDAVAARIELAAAPYGVVPAPDRSRYYVLEANGISVVDKDLSTVEHRIPLREQPTTLLFLDPPTRAFVSFLDSSQVSVVDLAQCKVLADITTGRTGKKLVLAAAEVLSPTFGPGPYTVPDPKTLGLLSPDGTLAFLSNTQTMDQTVVDTESLAVLDKFPGSRPTIVLDGKALVAIKVKDMVLYDLETRTVVPEMELGTGVSSISPGGRYIWAALGSKVAVFDLQERRRIKTYDDLRGLSIEFMPAPGVPEQPPAVDPSPPASKPDA